MAFPQLIEEDVQCIDAALRELLGKSEADTILLVEKSGHLIHKCGDEDQCNPEVLATLASNSFNAVQFMAGLLKEDNFPGLYQQGEHFSTLMLNLDEQCMLVIIFKAALSVGAVRFYAADTIRAIGDQIKKAQLRAPEKLFDLTDLNLTDSKGLFRKREAVAGQSPEAATPPVEPVPPPRAVPAETVHTPVPPAEPSTPNEGAASLA